jgi:Fur family ferric uptake transcriptional regulator
MYGRHGRHSPWWGKRFRGCGYRLTLPRKAIVEVLTGAKEHLSAEDVYMAVHKKYPEVGLTTVYRTLGLLVDMGVVFKLDFGDGKSRYELAEGPEGYEHHHHLVCTSCNRVVNYTDFIDEEVELLKKTEQGLSKKYNFDIKNHLIQFYGLCENCR